MRSHRLFLKHLRLCLAARTARPSSGGRDGNEVAEHLKTQMELFVPSVTWHRKLYADVCPQTVTLIASN